MQEKGRRRTGPSDEWLRKRSKTSDSVQRWILRHHLSIKTHSRILRRRRTRQHLIRRRRRPRRRTTLRHIPRPLRHRRRRSRRPRTIPRRLRCRRSRGRRGRGDPDRMTLVRRDAPTTRRRPRRPRPPTRRPTHAMSAAARNLIRHKPRPKLRVRRRFPVIPRRRGRARPSRAAADGRFCLHDRLLERYLVCAPV